MLWGAMAMLCEVMWAPSLRGENMKAAGPRRKLSSATGPRTKARLRDSRILGETY